MFIFQMRSGGTMAKTKTSTPTPRVNSCERRATAISGTGRPDASRRCIHTSFTMELDALIKSELTVEMDAAKGPMMATPASAGGRLCTMAAGMMLSTEPP